MRQGEHVSEAVHKAPIPCDSEQVPLQVDELMGVLERGGPALLEGYSVQGLSWEQVKQLKGPNLVGLGMGPGPAPGVCSHLVCFPLHHGTLLAVVLAV